MFSQTSLILVLEFVYFGVDPFVEPAHLELGYFVEELFKEFQSSCSPCYVLELDLLDLIANMECFVHDHRCYGDSKEERIRQFVEQIEEYNNDAHALKDE